MKRVRPPTSLLIVSPRARRDARPFFSWLTLSSTAKHGRDDASRLRNASDIFPRWDTLLVPSARASSPFGRRESDGRIKRELDDRSGRWSHITPLVVWKPKGRKKGGARGCHQPIGPKVRGRHSMGRRGAGCAWVALRCFFFYSSHPQTHPASER